MNLREVRKKIKAVGNVKKITKAMQLVSSVKMKKAQQKAIEGRPYREHLQEMIRRVSGSDQMKESMFIIEPKVTQERDLVIFITANKGLSGSFLTTLDRYVVKKLDYGKTDFISIGKKGASFLGITKGKIIADFSSLHPETEVGAIFSLVFEQFKSNKYNKVYIVYNKFINTMKFETVKEQLLPIQMSDLTAENKQHGPEATYVIEPLSMEIINALLKSFLEERIRGAILNSEAAEHSSRMLAMKNATDNANTVIYNLTLEGNKLRQAKITSELLDMITAKESVESSQ